MSAIPHTPNDPPPLPPRHPTRAAVGWAAAAATTIFIGLMGASDFEGGRGIPGRWERAQFVAAPGLDEPRKAGVGEGFGIRYRTIWPQ